MQSLVVILGRNYRHNNLNPVDNIITLKLLNIQSILSDDLVYGLPVDSNYYRQRQT